MTKRGGTLASGNSFVVATDIAITVVDVNCDIYQLVDVISCCTDRTIAAGSLRMAIITGITTRAGMHRMRCGQDRSPIATNGAVSTTVAAGTGCIAGIPINSGRVIRRCHRLTV